MAQSVVRNFIGLPEEYGIISSRAVESLYEALEARAERVEVSLADFRTLRNKRLLADCLDQQLYAERELAFEVAAAKLELANSLLFDKLALLGSWTAKLREDAGNANELKQSRVNASAAFLAAVRNNILCAEQLCNQTAALYFEVRRDYLRPVATSLQYRRVAESFADSPVLENPREFIVICTLHGSRFGLSGQFMRDPVPPPYMTLEEAKAEALAWRDDNRDSGGRAEIHNVRTGRTITDF